MLNTKFFKVYKQFTPKDRSELADYVAFRQISSAQPLHKLLAIIQQSYDEGADEHLKKEKVFAQLLPGERFNALKFNNYLSDLFSLLKEFLVQREVTRDDDLQAKMLRKAWRSKGLSKLFESSLKDHLGKLGEQRNTPNQFLMMHEALLEADQYYIDQAAKKDYTYLKESADALEVYYLEQNLRCYCELINRKGIIGVEYDELALADFLNYLRSRMAERSFTPFIAIYATILDCLMQPEDDGNYDKLEVLLGTHVKNLPQQQAKEICYNAQNFCVKRINEGRSEYLQKYLALFQLMLEERLIFDGDYLSQWNYKNITTVGLRLKEYEWTQRFLEDYATHLLPSEQENAYHYNKAACDYEMGNYDSAMQLLNTVKFNDPTYYLGSKSMLLKIYYELEEFDALNSLCDTFRVYLLRNKKQLAKIHPEGYTNLIRFCQQMSKLRNGRQIGPREKYEQSWQKLFQRITDSKKVGNKQWLLTQMEELRPDSLASAGVEEASGETTAQVNK